jgi:hypothetical protein
MKLSSVLYYIVKPLLPRYVQVAIRGFIAKVKANKYKDIWPIDEATGKKPCNWIGWPNGEKFALVLTHDVETGAGQERCKDLMEMEKKRGFLSSFNFVPERYEVSKELRDHIVGQGFEVAVHDLRHDGKLYKSKKLFLENAKKINEYLKDWNSVGFRAGAMHHDLDLIHALDIEYDASTFDTDPLEPQPDGVGTIFPFRVDDGRNGKGYIELPYSLPQDFTLFILLKQNNIDIWKKKLDWIAGKGGLALFITHPDYMSFHGDGSRFCEYPVAYYTEFLEYIQDKYGGQYWNVLPKDLAIYCKKCL